MCRKFTVLTRDEVLEVVRALEMRSPFNVQPDWPAVRPAHDDASPGAQAWVISARTAGGMGAAHGLACGSTCADGLAHGSAHTDGAGALERCAPVLPSLALEPRMLTWGYLLPGSQKLVFNTRSESAATSPLWRESFASRRCVVPAWSFYEAHQHESAVLPSGRKGRQLYRFAPSNASNDALLSNAAMPISPTAPGALSGTVSGAESEASLQGGSGKGQAEAFGDGSCPDGVRISDGAGAATIPISSIPSGPLRRCPFLMAGIWQDDRFSVLTCEPDAQVARIHDRMPLLFSPATALTWLNGGAPEACRASVGLSALPVYPPASEPEQLSLF